MPKYLPFGSPSPYPQIMYNDHHDTLCRTCDRALSGDVWLIVVITPDLPDLVHSHDLQSLDCENCGSRTAIDAPMMICRLGFDPPLVFSPAWGTSPEEDQDAFEWLVDIIKKQVGTLWDDGWLADTALVLRTDLAEAIWRIAGRQDGPVGLDPSMVRALRRGVPG